MFIEKCDIQNLGRTSVPACHHNVRRGRLAYHSAIGAACETQKQHAAPMELDCGTQWFVYKHIAPNGAFHGIFFKILNCYKKRLY